MPVAIVPAALADIPAIQAAARAAWRATYRDIYTPEQIDARLLEEYSAEHLAEHIQDPESVFLVARGGDAVIGYCLYGPGAHGWQLYRIYVVPEHWGAGVGAMLLDSLEAALLHRRILEYYCYVDRRNALGQGFYTKRGFTRRPDLDTDEDWFLVKTLG